jgi:hypothetical protein
VNGLRGWLVSVVATFVGGKVEQKKSHASSVRISLFGADAVKSKVLESLHHRSSGSCLPCPAVSAVAISFLSFG